MGRTLLIALFVLGGALELQAEIPTHGYATQLVLDAFGPGDSQTLTGHGAPDRPGVYVELWRIAPGTNASESVASVRAIGGSFRFEGIDVVEGESYYVTLSRSWNFETDGDLEGWGAWTNDVSLDVSNGTLNVTIEGVDPFFFNYFDYDSNLYRVIEVRLRNPAPIGDPTWGQDLGFYWGDYGSQVNLHYSEIPSEASTFETVFIPMNVGEVIVSPGPLQFEMDGLWATGLHDSLRVDPLDTVHPDAIGLLFEIDYIRIREDLRVDFNSNDDLAGLGGANMDQLTVVDGFLSFLATDTLDPSLFFRLKTGKLESGYFTDFVIGMDNSVADASSSLRVMFNDDDSGDTFIDDGGTLQVAELNASLSGRQDLAMVMDLHTEPQGEWTEDGRVPVQGLQLDLPSVASLGDEIRVDYLGFVSANPYGPSDPVFVPYPVVNHPPVAVIVSDPPASSPVELVLRHGEARAVLDASQSHDGDDGTQVLSFWWDGEGDGLLIDQPDQPIIEVLFTETGEFLCRVTVSDGELTDSAVQAIVVKSHRVANLEQRIEKLQAYIVKLQEKLAAVGNSGCEKKKGKWSAKYLKKKIKVAEKLILRLERRLEKRLEKEARAKAKAKA